MEKYPEELTSNNVKKCVRLVDSNIYSEDIWRNVTKMSVFRWADFFIPRTDGLGPTSGKKQIE